MQKEAQWLVQNIWIMAVKAAIDRFLRVEHNKPFSIIGSPVFVETNFALQSFIKFLRRTGKIGGIVHKTSLKTNCSALFKQES